MNKTYIYIIMCIAAVVMTGCQSDESLPVQHADGYGVINFSVSTQEMVSRGEIPYNNYDAEKYPSTMGVFGFHDAYNAGNMILNNTTLTASGGTTTSTQWTYEEKKYWEDYATFTSFDFFAYMPHLESGVTLSNTSNSWKFDLSFPFTMSECLTYTPSICPMICKTPVHTALIQQDIKFYMDQTMTGFNLQFSVGSKMDNVRDITITSVKLKGSKDVFATGGTVSRHYERTGTGSAAAWTADPIKWSDVTHPASNPEITINNPLTGDHKDLVLTTTPQKWGSDFYVIPTTGFTPTIEVTYTVTLNGTTDASGTYTPGETTRKTLTNNITLNSSNFQSYNPDRTKASFLGNVYPINIKIVPSYLYVLADADQETGYIVINQ